jgi:hypothetical protein
MSIYTPELLQQYMYDLDSKWSYETDETRRGIYDQFTNIYYAEYNAGSPYLLVNLQRYLDSLENSGTVSAQMYPEAYAITAAAAADLRQDFYLAFRISSGNPIVDWFRNIFN